MAGAGSGSHLGAHNWYTKEPRLGPRSTDFIFFCICLFVWLCWVLVAAGGIFGVFFVCLFSGGMQALSCSI